MENSGERKKSPTEPKAARRSEERLFELMRQEAGSDYHRTLRKAVEGGSHPSHEMLYDYVLDWLDDETCGSLMDHIALCASCAREVLRIRSIEEDAEEDMFDWIGRQADTTGEHLPTHVLEQILKGKSNERFRQHLISCEQCREHLQELEETANHPAEDVGYVDFSELKTLFSEDLGILEEAIKSTVEIFSHMPVQVFASAFSGAHEPIQQLEAFITDAAGKRVGSTGVVICDSPRIAHGVFTTEIEVRDERYHGCEVTIGIHLRTEGIVLTTRDVIPSDGTVYVREEIGIDGCFTIHPHMLVVAIYVPGNGSSVS